MINLELFFEALASPHVLLSAILVSFSVKIYFLCILIPKGLRAQKIHIPWMFLLGIIIGSMFGDIAWIVKLFREIWWPDSSYKAVTFLVRLAWGFLILQYQSLALFIESLTEKNFKLRRIHYFLILVGGSISVYFFRLAFFDPSLTNEFERTLVKELLTPPVEITIMRYSSYYLFNLILLPCLYVAFMKLRSPELPKILKKQLRIFIQFLICPYILTELLQAANSMFHSSFGPYLYPTVGLSTMLLIYAIYYCINRVIGLRFLNFANHVQSSRTFDFIDDFKTVVDQLSHTTSTHELNHIVQTFFKDAFTITPRNVTLYIRPNNESKVATTEQKSNNKIETITEHFLSSHNGGTHQLVHKNKVIIYDEIIFTNFYDEDEIKKDIVYFLDTINADVFLPIYEQQQIIAYIIIERNSLKQDLYSNIERDEMLMLANYLGNVIHLLKNRNLERMMHSEKELKDDLQAKTQEISYYKESMRSFLKGNRHKDIGIVFYKNRRFTLGNQAAKEFIKININTQEGHPLTQACKHVARLVEEYNAPQMYLTKDSHGNKLVLNGAPNLEQNNVIITIYYPEISDIITNQIIMLKDPSKWDYVLYLETTHAGTLINQLIPGDGETLLQCKINTLKAALQPKVIAIDFHEEDFIASAELLHHISKRETLHALTIHNQEKNHEYAVKLFGIQNGTPHAIGLLKSLDQTGTLAIQNIDLLDLETQEQLADYIRTGFYTLHKSAQKLSSSVNIICSTSQPIKNAINDGSLHKSLWMILQKNVLSFPSLTNLQEEELASLINGLAEQAIKSQAFKNMLELSDKEKNKLMLKRPHSLHELKQKVQQALVQKSKKNHIYNEAEFDPAYAITDPELVEAARMGKHALRDSKIMALLWNKFKNQNQIATFLGVNRSSVNRRCKDYKLL